jgi:ABC-type polysaccharide/polyol phosphate transport system ATPase subunit
MSVEPTTGGTLPAIVARNVSKTFTVPEQQVHTLKERVLHPRTRVRTRSFAALRDVSFHVAQGEFFGIAGRNGSGKSTLLKCLAGIYGADGQIWRRGRMSTMIELGVGFNMELAARENVILNGIMLGLTPREARRRYEDVIDFAELRDFQELKIKNYSSGMVVRLAFSVAMQVDADLMLIDEILAVGDAAFQQKCFDAFTRMRDEGKTIVFVTHDMGSMIRFCHRAMLLEQGEMIHTGTPEEVADRYLEINFGRLPQAQSAPGEARSGDGDARVEEVWIEDAEGERREAVIQGERVKLCVRVRFHVRVADPAASVFVLNDEHKAVTVASTEARLERTGSFDAGEQAVFSFAFENILAPGRYSPMVSLSHRGAGLDVIDRFEASFTFVVTATHAMGGVVDLPVSVTVERGDDALAAPIDPTEVSA